MKWTLLLLSLAIVGAQEPASAPAVEAPVSGTLEIGHRWRSRVGGNFDTYRSVVDLGSGPKLMGLDFSITDPKALLFDRMEARAQDWGDDPYSSAQITARKNDVYDFSANYRNMAYFNALPSFANPLLDRGVLANQRSFDIRRRLASFNLDIRPGSVLTPYLAYERSSGYGGGVTTFVSNANEYAVPSRTRDKNDTYRGGLRLELRNFHATGELGETVFKDDQHVFETTPLNTGNRGTPYLNRTLLLTGLQQAYGVRGKGLFSRLLFTSTPLPWLDVYGNYSYGRPNTETNYQQYNTGNFSVPGAASFVTTQQFALASQARMPHTAASFGLELRPLPRTRLLASWLTDRLHNVASPNFDPVLRNDYSQSDVDLIVDASRQWTLRGGYRYVWGEGESRDVTQFRRHVGKAGFTFRPAMRLTFSADAEVGASGAVYFRTSLNDYQRVRLKGRYQATNAITITGDYTLLHNANPAGISNFSYRSRSISTSLLWAPASLEGLQVLGTYMRGTIHSDTTYVVPQTFDRERYLYRDDSHTADGRISISLPRYKGLAPQFSAGGAFFWSSGSRPTQHYQPLASLVAPITKMVSWTSEWRYHGFGETFYTFEAFRAHLVTTGLRIRR